MSAVATLTKPRRAAKAPTVDLPPRTFLQGDASDLERLEVALLLEGIYQHYGFDFRSYALASLKRRLKKRMGEEGITTLSALQDRVLHDQGCMERLLTDLTVHSTSMFRDPQFFLRFRQLVVPILQTYPFVRIWHAGCSTGEEVYSMAILLQEEGLYDRTRIYATDMSEVVLRHAKSGIFSLAKMKDFTAQYLAGGGKRSFSEYYTAKYDGALFAPELTRNVIFSQHNLVTDGSFSEFNVILCRNVLIYFDRDLQDRVLQLMDDSLSHLGFLCLGRKESLRFTVVEERLQPFDARQRILRKVTP